MNLTAVKSIIFFAEFTREGFLTEQSRREYESCLERAWNWGATLRIVHAKPISDIATSSFQDYDNSQVHRARRRADYVLSGLILRAEERGLKAEAGVVYGAIGVSLARDLGSKNDTVIWSDFSAPAPFDSL